jgi:hypothetical protein
MRLLRSRKRKVIAAAGAAGIIVASAGGAFAYWSGNAAGTGEATAATGVSAVVITSDPVTGLVPGGPAANITAYLKNNNPGTVTFNPSSNLVVSGAVDPAHSGCVFATNFVLTQPTYLVGSSIGPGQLLDTPGGTIQLVDLPNVDQNACKGATVTLTYSIS